MTRISSRQTVFSKRILPWLLLVFLAIPIGIGLTLGQGRAPFQLFLMPLVMVPVFVVLFRKLLWDLMDEVYDGGDYLLVKNGGKEDRIALSNIMNVSATIMVNPPR